MAYPDSLRAALETALLDAETPVDLEGAWVEFSIDSPLGEDSWELGTET